MYEARSGKKTSCGRAWKMWHDEVRGSREDGSEMGGCGENDARQAVERNMHTYRGHLNSHHALYLCK